MDENLCPFNFRYLGITVVDKGSASASRVLGGRFFGPAHDEMAGTLDDPGQNLLPAAFCNGYRLTPLYLSNF